VRRGHPDEDDASGRDGKGSDDPDRGTRALTATRRANCPRFARSPSRASSMPRSVTPTGGGGAVTVPPLRALRDRRRGGRRSPRGVAATGRRSQRARPRVPLGVGPRRVLRRRTQSSRAMIASQSDARAVDGSVGLGRDCAGPAEACGPNTEPAPRPAPAAIVPALWCSIATEPAERHDFSTPAARLWCSLRTGERGPPPTGPPPRPADDRRVGRSGAASASASALGAAVESVPHKPRDPSRPLARV
jgi:hypothetical protein